MSTSTTIDGFLCEIEPIDDHRVGCYISKGRFFASLDAASDEGLLWDDRGEKSLAISFATLGRIENWAIEQGY